MRKVFFILVILFSVSIVFGLDGKENYGIEIVEGRNNFSGHEFEPFYAKDFVLNNPEIVSISYSVSGNSYGFLDVFGGIGTNFVVVPEIEYEVVARENVTLYLR